jgi:hypothetical protein
VLWGRDLELGHELHTRLHAASKLLACALKWSCD